MKRFVHFPLLLLLCAGSAHAQIMGNDIQVGVGVLALCQINSVNDINFGTLDPDLGADSFAQGEISFACTRGMNYRVAIDNGQYFDANRQTNQMVSQGSIPSYIPYKITLNNSSGLGTGFQKPVGLILNATIRGQDYRDQPAGAYHDTVRITFEP